MVMTSGIKLALEDDDISQEIGEPLGRWARTQQILEKEYFVQDVCFDEKNKGPKILRVIDGKISETKYRLALLEGNIMTIEKIPEK